MGGGYYQVGNISEGPRRRTKVVNNSSRWFSNSAVSKLNNSTRTAQKILKL